MCYSTSPLLDASLASGSRLGSPHPPPSVPSSDRDRDDESTPGHPTSPTPFNGDYFGDYEPGYWDDYDEYQGPADESGVGQFTSPISYHIQVRISDQHQSGGITPTAV